MINPNNILSVRFDRFQHSRFLRFIDVAVELCQGSGVTEARILAKVTALRQAYDTMQALLNKRRANMITPAIEEADGLRDRATVGIRAALRAFEMHFSEPKQQAARYLGNTMDRYSKSIARLRYIEQTEVTFAILAEIDRTPAIQDAVNVLGMTDWFDELRRTNQEFDRLYIERTKDYATISQANFQELREQSTSDFRELTALITAFSIVSAPSPMYESLIRELNSHIEQYNEAVIARSNENELEEEEGQAVDSEVIEVEED